MNYNLPGYVPTEDPVLSTPSRLFEFPLSEEDKHDLATLEAKYDQEENCAGLAAPQLGIGKAAIIFSANNPELKKFRQDFDQMMPRTLWLNPTYEGVGNETADDWEACFSIPGTTSLVKRHTTIMYHAYNIEGAIQTGTATGFLARLIQHEIDHVKGILCSTRAIQPMTVDEYRTMRQKAMEQ